MRELMGTIERAGIGNGIKVTTAGTRGVERTGQSEGGKKTASVEGGRGDEVQLSPLAAQIESLQPNSPARVDRVNALREAVSGGQYKVDAQALASQIVKDAGGD